MTGDHCHVMLFDSVGRNLVTETRDPSLIKGLDLWEHGEGGNGIDGIEVHLSCSTTSTVINSPLCA